MVAFHDARHFLNENCESGPSEDGEYCVVKAYRTDALLQMKDLSDASNKETIATSLAITFPSASRYKYDRARAHQRLSDTGSNILTRTKNAVVQYLALSLKTLPWKNENRGLGNNVVLGTPPPQLVVKEENTGSGSERPWTSGSESSTLHTQPFTLSRRWPPYSTHEFFFSLTPGSSIGSRYALSLSDSVNGSTIDWCSLRSWLKACETDHPGCRLDDQNLPPKEGMRIRCIDVRTSQIVAVGFETRYLTLSYVWGGAINEISRQVDRSLTKDKSRVITQYLPPAVRDAIKVTKRLHERYLWVDCVCIDQTDKAVLQEQVDLMDRIYENSLITLITATCDSAQEPIPGLQRNSRLKSSVDVVLEGRLMKGMCTQTVHSFDGAWQKRGWTFQEWLLSRRCLIFSHNQIMFRCHESSGLESFTPPVSSSLSGAGPMSHFWADPRCTSVTLPRKPLGNPHWNFQTYAELVRDYSFRTLTYDSDVLHAFTGIMRKLERSCGMSFAEGFPRTDLLRALLFNDMYTSFLLKEIYMPRRLERPSWAWCANGHQSAYFCWEADEEPALAGRCQSVVGPQAHNSRGARAKPASSERGPWGSVVILMNPSFLWLEGKAPERFNAVRYRFASVELLPESSKRRARSLLVSSETRKTLVHHNPAELKYPEFIQEHKCSRSRDSVLHPQTKMVIAGRNFAGLGGWLSPSWQFHVNAGPKGGNDFAPHDAVILYEWDIEDENGIWNRDVIVMIIKRLDDGTTERVSLAAIRTEDWDTLPLVSKREDLILV
jgi:Heterokaryon incompatibility protein (HET)